FFVGCHCLATSGNRAASELVTDTCCPAQKGQPLPPAVLLATVARHSWSRPLEQRHQTFAPDPATIWSDVRFPFFVGCSSAANSGKHAASEFVAETFRLEQ